MALFCASCWWIEKNGSERLVWAGSKHGRNSNSEVLVGNGDGSHDVQDGDGMYGSDWLDHKK